MSFFLSRSEPIHSKMRAEMRERSAEDAPQDIFFFPHINAYPFRAKKPETCARKHLPHITDGAYERMQPPRAASEVAVDADDGFVPGEFLNAVCQISGEFLVRQLAIIGDTHIETHRLILGSEAEIMHFGILREPARRLPHDDSQPLLLKVVEIDGVGMDGEEHARFLFDLHFQPVDDGVRGEQGETCVDLRMDGREGDAFPVAVDLQIVDAEDVLFGEDDLLDLLREGGIGSAPQELGARFREDSDALPCDEQGDDDARPTVRGDCPSPPL